MIGQNYIDLTTLPRKLAHSQLGGGLGACAWYSPWDCYVPADMQQAAMELQDSHNWLLDFANAAQQFLDDARSGGAPADIIAGFQSSLDDSVRLVQQHSQIMNEFYAKTGLQGLGTTGRGKVEVHGMGSLGIWTLLIPALVTLLTAVARIFAWSYISNVVGSIASVFRQDSDVARDKFKARGDCYIAYRQAVEAGTTPPDCSQFSADSSFPVSTLAIAGAAALVLIMLFRR